MRSSVLLPVLIALGIAGAPLSASAQAADVVEVPAVPPVDEPPAQVLYVTAKPAAAQARPRAPARTTGPKAPWVAPAKTPQAVLELETPRIRVGDIFPDAPDVVVNEDLGPTPPPGGARMVMRLDVERAYASHELRAPALPPSIRVTRKTKAFSALALERAARDAFTNTPPKGTTLIRIRTPPSASVPTGWEVVRVELARMPRRTGSVSTSGTLAFLRGEEVLVRLPISMDLELSDAALVPDVARGSTLTLVMRKGAVEVSTDATSQVDGDVGDVVPVTVKAFSRNARARLLDRGHALLVEAS